ncbi:MAG: type II toxin-antitoxin system VapC family toxin [Caulobacteraceae bacterium]|nr:type II toxin-antitoxin system VapC family toxin [Caulobacter sp.]
MTVVVVDASVAVKWVLEEPGSDEAEALIQEELIAPPLFETECANVLWKAWRRGELSAQEARTKLDDILAGGVALRQPSLNEALSIATRLDHPVYDCAYVALALEGESAFATADRKLANKLKTAGVDVRLILIGLDAEGAIRPPDQP